MRIFEDSEFRSYLQSSLDSKVGFEQFSKDEREIDWKLAYEAGISRTRREWAKRWQVAIATAQKTHKEMEQLVIGLAGQAIIDAQDTHPPIRDEANVKSNAKPNKESAQTAPKTQDSANQVNAQVNAKVNTDQAGQQESRTHAHTHAQLRTKGSGILDSPTTSGAEHDFDGDSWIDSGQGDPFNVDHVAGKVQALVNQNDRLLPALEAAGVTIEELAFDIFCFYGKLGGFTATGQAITKKNLYFVVASGWITPKLRRIAKGESPASVFQPTYRMKNHGAEQPGNLADDIRAAFATN